MSHVKTFKSFTKQQEKVAVEEQAPTTPATPATPTEPVANTQAPIVAPNVESDPAVITAKNKISEIDAKIAALQTEKATANKILTQAMDIAGKVKPTAPTA